MMISFCCIQYRDRIIGIALKICKFFGLHRLKINPSSEKLCRPVTDTCRVSGGQEPALPRIQHRTIGECPPSILAEEAAWSNPDKAMPLSVAPPILAEEEEFLYLWNRKIGVGSRFDHTRRAGLAL